jgi:hypothetical protein
MREGKDKDGNIKYSSATGAKGFRWLEAEMVKELEKQDDIDRSYYEKQIDTAIETISKYGDVEWFISDDPYIPANPSQDSPPWDVEENTSFDVR